MTDNAAFLYPVPCVEYYVLCMLDFLNLCPHYAYPFMYKVQDAYRRGTGFTDTYNIPGVAGSCSTFERLCKFLLDNTDIQYRNISVLSNKCKDGMGRFYVTDSSDIDLENKSRVLWYQFPLDLLGIHSAMDLDSMEARRHWEMYSSNYNNWLNNYQTVPFDSILTDSDKYQLEAAFTAANTEER